MKNILFTKSIVMERQRMELLEKDIINLKENEND
jgi:hypothetical protein